MLLRNHTFNRNKEFFFEILIFFLFLPKCAHLLKSERKWECLLLLQKRSYFMLFSTNFMKNSVFYRQFQFPTLWRSQLWLLITAKSGLNVSGFRKLQNFGFNRFFFTFCDGKLLYYRNGHIVTVTNDFVRSSHNEDGYRNNYQKLFCFWLSNITSLCV
jgi:hypothetical protein